MTSVNISTNLSMAHYNTKGLRYLFGPAQVLDTLSQRHGITA